MNDLHIVIARYDSRDVEAYGPFLNADAAREWADQAGYPSVEVVNLRTEMMTLEAFDALKESLP